VKIRAISRRRVLTGAAAVSAAAILPRASLGADWRPTETVRIIVPAAAGGSTDVMGRLLAAHLQTAWGQSAVVENRSGGGGTIGHAEVARNKGDGHTILIGNPGPNAIAYSIFRNMTYKAGAVAAGQQHDPDSEHRVGASVDRHQVDPGPDRLHQGKSRQAQLRLVRRWAEPSPHRRLVPAIDRAENGARAVPRRRSGAAGGMAGDIQILFDNLYPSLPQTQDGKLTALCVTTPERSPAAPDIPTMREGVPELSNFDVSSWFGIFLPKATPAPAVEALNKEIKTMLAREDIKTTLGKMGATPTGARRSNSPISCRRRRRNSPRSSSAKGCRWT
jgi:tripartite-type tricarboxylate transporter receptor subunit TctC